MNLPVPSFHDCETANVSKFKTLVRFLCSVVDNCIDVCVIPSLNCLDPILLDITSLISSLLNLIKTLEG